MSNNVPKLSEGPTNSLSRSSERNAFVFEFTFVDDGASPGAFAVAIVKYFCSGSPDMF